MAPRPIWEGHLRLSLVTCPVRLSKATGEGDEVHFHLLAPETHNQVKQAWKDPADGEVPRSELLRGYEVSKGEYVIVDDAEIKALKLESSKVIDIERFVEGSAIDRVYWDQPYYLVPDGKTAAEPYAVIREAMERQDRVALGRLVMTNRERIVALEVRKNGMLLTTLHSHDEVRDDSELFEAIPTVRISPQMIEIAKQIIAQTEGPFAPEQFHDRYQEALRELVERKAEGVGPVKPRPVPEVGGNVIDLMDALRRSLKAPPRQRDAEARREARTEHKLSRPAGGTVKGEGESKPPRTTARRTGGKDGHRRGSGPTRAAG